MAGWKKWLPILILATAVSVLIFHHSPISGIGTDLAITSQESTISIFPNLTSCTNSSDVYKRKSENQEVARVLSEKAIINRTSDCDEYFRTIKPAALEIGSGLRAEFPIAFSHLVHKEIGILEVFLAEYYRPQNVHCIHVDKKSHPDVKKAVDSLTRCYSTRFNTRDSIYTASNAIDVVWGESSILMADLSCMRELVQKNKGWKYFMSMAGSELPLITAESLADILSRSNNTLFLDMYEKSDLQLFFHFGFFNLPKGLQVRKSLRDIAVPRSFAEHIISSDVAKSLLDVIVKRAGMSAEEYFYATLATLESSDGFKLANGTFRLSNITFNEWIGWKSGTECVRYDIWWHWMKPCHGDWVRSICNFAPEDLPRAYESGCFVANKFLLETQALAVYCHWNHLRELRGNQ